MTSTPSRPLDSRGAAINEDAVTVVAVLLEVAQALRELAERAPADPHQSVARRGHRRLIEASTSDRSGSGGGGVLPHRRFGKHLGFILDDGDAIVRHSMHRIRRTLRARLNYARSLTTTPMVASTGGGA